MNSVMTVDSPTPVPGRPSIKLFVRGISLEGVAFILVWPIILEGRLPGGARVWGPVFVSLVLSFGLSGLVVQIRSFARAKEEVAAGYTTAFDTAATNPALYYLDGRDLSVISAPHEARPRNGTRKAIDAYRANRSTSGGDRTPGNPG